MKVNPKKLYKVVRVDPEEPNVRTSALVFEFHLLREFYTNRNGAPKRVESALAFSSLRPAISFAKNLILEDYEVEIWEAEAKEAKRCLAVLEIWDVDPNDLGNDEDNFIKDIKSLKETGKASSAFLLDSSLAPSSTVICKDLIVKKCIRRY